MMVTREKLEAVVTVDLWEPPAERVFVVRLDLPVFPDLQVLTVDPVLTVPPVKLDLRVNPVFQDLLDPWVAPVWMVFPALVVKWVHTDSTA